MVSRSFTGMCSLVSPREKRVLHKRDGLEADKDLTGCLRALSHTQGVFRLNQMQMHSVSIIAFIGQTKRCE